MIIHGDCREEIKSLDLDWVDVIITDPPYPDYHTEEYNYHDGILDPIKNIDCRQLIFWSAKAPFPLDHTAVHIWDKKTGVGSMYERIFERNGGTAYRVFRHYLINSTVAASYAKDVYTGHSSQKPIGLMLELVERFSDPGDLVFDPFMGSGSTGVACAQLGREFIGIERIEQFYDIAKKRIEDAKKQIRLF